MDPSESDLGPRVSGIGLTAIALLLGGAVVAGEASPVYWILRQFTAAAMGGLLALGLLVAITGRDRPLTPLRGTLVPAGVALGLGALFGSDLLRYGADAHWVLVQSIHVWLVGSGFGAAVGSALARRKYGLGVAGSGTGLVVNGTTGVVFSTGFVGPLLAFLALGTPAAYVGYVFTDRDANGGSAGVGSTDATP